MRIKIHPALHEFPRRIVAPAPALDRPIDELVAPYASRPRARATVSTSRTTPSRACLTRSVDCFQVDVFVRAASHSAAFQRVAGSRNDATKNVAYRDDDESRHRDAAIVDATGGVCTAIGARGVETDVKGGSI